MSAQEHNPDSANRASMHGLTIGDFEILDEIGRGGMGVVYRARQLSLDRIVALKILAYGRGLSEQAVTRFRREAQATAKLHHPNIVPVYAQGQQDNTYFYAMELVSGTSLYDEICQLRRGDGPRAGKSRDRSPSSSDPGMVGGSSDILAEKEILADTEILERPIGEETIDAQAHILIDGEVIDGEVIDGKRLDSRDGAGADGFSSHTPDYFDAIARQTKSVADALGYAHQNGVIHRDIKPHNLLFGSGDRLCLSDFGLARIVEQPGVTQTGDFVGSPLYMSPEQITGKGGGVGVRSDIYSLGATLFEWMTLRPPFPGTTREQVISRVITEDPPVPRSINRRIPLDLETICLKALSRDPSKRYASAWDMRDDLERFLNRGAIKARRTSTLESIGKTISRNRVASVAAIAAVLIVALTFALVRQKSDKKTAQKTIAEKQQLVESVTEKNKQLEERLREEENGNPAESPPANPISEPMQRGEQLASMFKGPLASLLSSGDVESDAPLTNSQRIGAIFVARMRETESVRLADISPGTIAPDSAEGLYIAALAEDRPKAAVAKLDDCLALAPDHLQAHLLRAWHQCRLNEIAAMRADVNAVLAITPGSAEALLARSAVRILNGRHKLAIDDADQAALELDGDVRADLLRGLALAGMERWPAALNAMNLVLIIEPDNALALMVRARALFDLGRYNHAIVDLNRVIEQEPMRADALELRADCYDKVGEYRLARNDLVDAIKVAESGTFSLSTKLIVIAEKIDKQGDEVKSGVADSNGSGSETEKSGSPVSAPPKEGTVKSWLEKLLGNTKDKKNELRGLRMIAPDTR